MASARRILGFLALPLFLAPTALGQSDVVRGVEKQLSSLFSDPAFSRGTWAVKVKSLSTGEILYELDSYKYVMPASNMKLLTAAAAHRDLGLDFRFKTQVLANGQVNGGTLEGDLVIVGSGDPTLGARLSSPDPESPTRGDPFEIFRQWAERLREKGIQRVAGDVVGDPRRFDDLPLGSGWSWDDVGYGYSAQISGLQFNENSVYVRIVPASGVGQQATLSASPRTDYLTIANELVMVGPAEDFDISVYREPGTNRVRVHGTVPVGTRPFRRSVAVHDPARFFVTMLKDTLESEGISVSGTARVVTASDPEPAREPTPLFEHASPDLRYVLRTLLKVSQNLYAETLVKALDPEESGKTYERGRERIIRTLTSMGIPPESYILADGSGLSRYNYLSADALIRLLESVWRHSDRDEFLEFLPVAGVDGTLGGRMKGTGAEKNVRAKTGTLKNVRALAGFVTTADGEPLAFAMIANNFDQPMRAAEYLQDAALHFLANLKR